MTGNTQELVPYILAFRSLLVGSAAYTISGRAKGISNPSMVERNCTFNLRNPEEDDEY